MLSLSLVTTSLVTVEDIIKLIFIARDWAKVGGERKIGRRNLGKKGFLYVDFSNSNSASIRYYLLNKPAI